MDNKKATTKIEIIKAKAVELKPNRKYIMLIEGAGSITKYEMELLHRKLVELGCDNIVVALRTGGKVEIVEAEPCA